jgi:chemotaxis family two-component system response regulator Rcp1
MHSNEAAGALPLLHIDDSANDRMLVREAIFLSNTPFTFHQAQGMESAIPYFQSHGQKGESTQFPRPALVLLDYDLGDHTGTDLLYWLRLIRNVSSIPVIMFCGSVAQSQIAECYASGANHYLSKPKDLERLKIIVHTLHLSLVSLHRPGPIPLLQEYHGDPRERLLRGSAVRRTPLPAAGRKNVV